MTCGGIKVYGYRVRIGGSGFRVILKRCCREHGSRSPLVVCKGLEGPYESSKKSVYVRRLQGMSVSITACYLQDRLDLAEAFSAVLSPKPKGFGRLLAIQTTKWVGSCKEDTAEIAKLSVQEKQKRSYEPFCSSSKYGLMV